MRHSIRWAMWTNIDVSKSWMGVNNCVRLPILSTVSVSLIESRFCPDGSWPIPEGRASSSSWGGGNSRYSFTFNLTMPNEEKLYLSSTRGKFENKHTARFLWIENFIKINVKQFWLGWPLVCQWRPGNLIWWRPLSNASRKLRIAGRRGAYLFEGWCQVSDRYDKLRTLLRTDATHFPFVSVGNDLW